MDAHLLKRITDAYKGTTPPPKTSETKRALRKAFDTGFLDAPDVDDLLADYDDRLWCVPIKEIAQHFEIPSITIYPKPNRVANSAVGFEGYRLEHVIALLILFERLGFNVDPTPWVDAYAPRLDRGHLIDTELDILWFHKLRHKMVPITLIIPGRFPSGRSEQFKTQTGYKVRCGYDTDDTCVSIEVNAPKFRRRPDPVKTKCPECGHTWFKGDPDSSRIHRQIHRKEMRIRAPQPDTRLADALGDENTLLRVDPDSPQWQHNLVYAMAVRFRREERYDFAQWSAKARDKDAVAFIFGDDTGTYGQGAPAGACAFRLRSGIWTLDWIWIIPALRRRGILSRALPSLGEVFPEFRLQHPLSDAMEAFSARHMPWLEPAI